MHTYLIAGIKLSFSYRFDRFFKQNIESYEILSDGTFDHQIIMTYQKEITPPVDKGYRVFSKNAQGIKSMMIYDDHFKHIEIVINEDAFTDLETAEYIYSGMVFLEIAQLNGLLPLHSSAIVYKNEAILFSAPSGTGKSTHARLWKERFNDEVDWINDDKPLLKLENEKVFVYGAPFSGHYRANMNQKYPLKAIIFLQQGATNDVRKLDEKEALQKIMTNILRPKEEIVWDQSLSIINDIIKNISIYSLDATMNQEAVDAVYHTLYGEKK